MYPMPTGGGPPGPPPPMVPPPPHVAPEPAESKKDKRRRDMAERVARLLADSVDRREYIFQQLSDVYAKTAADLMPAPVFPGPPIAAAEPGVGVSDEMQAQPSTSSAGQNMASQQLGGAQPPPPLPHKINDGPPSVAFADPLVPPVFHLPYLFELHQLSLGRSNEVVAIKLLHEHQRSVARKLYEAEVERIEDEYESATKGVVDRLLDSVEERRRRLHEEKDSDGINLETLLDPQTRTHGTRRMRGGIPRPSAAARRIAEERSPGPNASDTSTGAAANGMTNGTNGTNGDRSAGNIAGLLVGPDPFNLANGLVPTGAAAASLAAAGATASILSGAYAAGPGGAAGDGRSGGPGRRRAGQRQQPGLPPLNYNLPPGTYHQFQSKAIGGLSTLRNDEIESDLGEVRRKRPRMAGHASAARRRTAAVNGD